MRPQNPQRVVAPRNKACLQKLIARHPGARGRGRIAERHLAALEIGQRLRGAIGGNDDYGLECRADHLVGRPGEGLQFRARGS